MMTNSEMRESLENAIKILEAQLLEIPNQIQELCRRKKVLKEAIAELIDKEIDEEYGI